MAKRKEEMTTMKVQKDMAQIIYTLAAAKSVSATRIIEEAVRSHFKSEVEAVQKIKEAGTQRQIDSAEE